MKILRSELAREHEVTERFLIEAKAASAIGNEHVIDISDFGQLPDGSAYFVMEFLDGQPLSAVLSAHKSLPAARILHIALQLAKGLEAAHKAGIVHRDLKPDNVFLITRAGDPDFVKVLDFGIAKVSSAATGRLTQAGSVFGTPHYMSPEQAAGAPVDHRGDIYAVGVMLYELATGSLPFQAENFMAILTQHIYKAPASLRTIEPSVPLQLEAIVLKCLSKRPEQRYQSMQELAQDLEAFRAGSIPSAVSEMMERSGGFSVPADFFKTARSATSQQPAKPRWPLYAGLAAIVAAGAWFLIGQSSSKETAHAPEPVAAAAQPKEAPASGAPTEEVQITSQVVLGIEPSTAHVFQGDKDLGMSPVVVNVPENQQVNVEVRQEGYATQTLKLDGTQQKMSVALEPLKPRHTAPKNTAPKAPLVDPKQKKPKSGSQIGGGEIVNPWAGG
jgi:serine/threonine-protein kinase